jgi:hypothetical protein
MAHPFEWKKGVRFYRRLKDKIAARSEPQLAAGLSNTGKLNYDPDEAPASLAELHGSSRGFSATLTAPTATCAV